MNAESHVESDHRTKTNGPELLGTTQTEWLQHHFFTATRCCVQLSP